MRTVGFDHSALLLPLLPSVVAVVDCCGGDRERTAETEVTVVAIAAAAAAAARCAASFSAAFAAAAAAISCDDRGHGIMHDEPSDDCVTRDDSVRGRGTCGLDAPPL